VPVTSKGAWLGFPEKYWAGVLASDASAPLHANEPSSLKTYQADYVQETEMIEGRQRACSRAEGRLQSLYLSQKLEPDRFGRLIDWGRL
jgi:hypothetical protein